MMMIMMIMMIMMASSYCSGLKSREFFLDVRYARNWTCDLCMSEEGKKGVKESGHVVSE